MAHTFMKINAFFRFIKHEFANWQGCIVIPRNVLYATYSNWSWSWFDSLYPPRLQRAAFVFFMFCSKGHASMNERGDRIICLSPCIVWSCGKFQVITEITITHRQQPRLSFKELPNLSHIFFLRNNTMGVPFFRDDLNIMPSLLIWVCIEITT